MLISLFIALLLLSAGLYVFAHHAPATPKQVTNQDELESYLNRLTASGNPPGQLTDMGNCNLHIYCIGVEVPP